MKINGKHIRFALTAIFVAVLAKIIYSNFDNLIDTVSKTSIWLVFVTALLLGCTQAISATKWCVLVNAAGVPTSLLNALRIFFIAMFVNAFGFGTVGGDIVRAIMLGGGDKGKSVCLATVVADRAIGLGVLASLGLCFGLFFGSVNSDTPILMGVAALVAVMAVFGWWFVPDILRIASKLLPRFDKFFSKLALAFPKEKKIFLKVVGLAVIYHLSQTLLIWGVISTVTDGVPLTYVLFAVPFINLISTLPLSWLGLGVRETLYITFFSSYSNYLTEPEAILVSMVWFLAMTIVSVSGGVLAVFTGDYDKLTTKRSSLNEDN